MSLFTHIGFTGTRQDMTRKQKRELEEVLTDIPGEVIFHHGDCIGADAQAHRIALKTCTIAIHPPTDSKYRAFCKDYLHIFKPRPYLGRNRDIVNSCSLIIACPKGEEKLRSGTWSTIRYAKKQKKELLIIKP